MRRTLALLNITIKQHFKVHSGHHGSSLPLGIIGMCRKILSMQGLDSIQSNFIYESHLTTVCTKYCTLQYNNTKYIQIQQFKH